MCDDVFDDEGDDRGLRVQELGRIQLSRTLEGYREGVIEGKESSHQEGFNDGFNDVVDTMSRLGRLHGILSALLSFHSCSKDQVLPPGELSDIESLLHDVREFEDRTRTAIKAMESTLPALPADGNMKQSIESFSTVDESTISEDGTFSEYEEKVSTLAVSKVPTDDGVSASVAPSCDRLDGSPSVAIVNETPQVGVVSTNGDSKGDASSFDSVKFQMKLRNRELIDVTKIVCLEKECRRIVNTFGLSEPLYSSVT